MSIILFSILAFITPILFGTPTFETYEFPKMMFVYLAGGTIIWLFFLKPKKIALPSREIIAFVVFYALSTLLSIHWYTSIWGYYKRFNGGLVSTLIFVGIFTVLINEYRKAQIRELINYMAFASIPISIFAVYQHFNGVVRAYSTFGQANWLAAFLVMTALIALTNLFGTKDKRDILLWSLVFVLSFCGMWVTYSMSGILGFLAGLIYFFVLHKNEMRSRLRQLTIIFGLIFLFSITNPGIFGDKVRDIFIDIRKVYAIDEPIENAVSDPGFIRTELWMGTLKLWVSSPRNMLVGTGPETFPYAYQPFRSPSLNYSSEWEFVFNKPHNYYLELLSTVGILATIAYVLILKKALNPIILGFAVTNFFGWPTVATALLFWMILAYSEAKE